MASVNDEALRNLGFTDEALNHIHNINDFLNNKRRDIADMYLQSFVNYCKYLAQNDPVKYPYTNYITNDLIKNNPSDYFRYYVGYIAGLDDNEHAGEKSWTVGETGAPIISYPDMPERMSDTYYNMKTITPSYGAYGPSSAKFSPYDGHDAYDYTRPDVAAANSTKTSQGKQGGLAMLKSEASEVVKTIEDNLIMWSSDPKTAAKQLAKYIKYKDMLYYEDAIDKFCTQIAYQMHSRDAADYYRPFFGTIIENKGSPDGRALYEWVQESMPEVFK